MAETMVRRELVAACRRLDKLGFVPGASGNVSARLAGERLLITPSGVSLGALTEGDLVEVRGDGTMAGGGTPSSESSVHRVFDQVRDEVNAVIHAHSRGCMAFAMARRDFGEPCNLEVLAHIGRPALVPFAPPGESGPLLESVAGRADCFLLANHGVVVLGGSLRQAVVRLEVMENFALSLIDAHRLGGPVPFSAEERSRIERFMDRIGAAKPRSMAL